MSQEKYQQIFAAERPYLEQTKSWCEGMRYRYSPERYPLSQNQVQKMSDCGQLMGQVLDQKFGRYSVIEFRIDYVIDQNRQPWVAEVQTDDRGLPAIANERNARGFIKSERFPGVTSSFLEPLQITTKKDYPVLLITYPQQEQFYYNGFFDFAQMCFAAQMGPQILIAPQETISPKGNVLKIRFNLEGLDLTVQPDLIWDFGNNPDDNPLEGLRSIQPQTTKQLLVDIWSTNSPLTQNLRKYVPPTVTVTPGQASTLIDAKDSWVIKPVSEKWSKGVTIGRQVDQSTWTQRLQANIPLVAQRFVDPHLDYFWVATKNGQFARQSMYSRIEGYYCATESSWTLADVLVTATPNYPVHGRRDCIMTVAQVI